MQTPISILPADERLAYAAAYMERKGGRLCSSYSELPDSGYIICGVPFTKDGTHLNTTLEPSISLADFLGMLTDRHTLIGGTLPVSVTEYCMSHNIRHYDYMASREFARQDARLTAEGLLIPILSKTKYSICDCVPLVVGYGTCGREISDILSTFIDEIYICETHPKRRRHARQKGFHVMPSETLSFPDSINILINTSPENPFPEHIWKKLPRSCAIFQVASGTLHLPFPLSENLILCPGVPSNYAPKTAGTLIARDICHYFHIL